MKNTHKNTTKPHKYTPKTNEDLAKLAQDESIYLGDIDTSAITDMSWLFQGSERKDFSGIETWDTSSVTNMSGMFASAEFFNHPIGSWDTSSVKDMSWMFKDAISFNQPLDSWDVSSAESIVGMFWGATAFSQPLHSWDIRKDASRHSVFVRSGVSEYPKWIEA
ncbi:hypothetical protein BKN38_05680 [Helicobacter sp. CLO-3]|uniref:BspA family leucine-rich repeat surface protein n=1 Tax=unclassified Helicobacter TaxID=2593540 RepID=UPI0008058333|nr:MULTISPECIES: BspA family leucine-rich repeat surface protein [unclassified Helicobacter]OBV29980.1 hypothetical protein BA723_03265 [Helicobacter sp. CLO-3]OHU83199.1 hypothetical protein BKN38_05680 [Helicobacter sp. CLO-3]